MFKIFKQYKNISCGVSDKTDGPMELEGGALSLAKNRRRFFKRQKLDNFKSISPLQGHSTYVAKVTLADINQKPKNADGLVTVGRNLLLTFTVADCFPLYFYDPAANTIALAHSGWRGAVDNISEKIIKTMGSNPNNILVGIGPGIQVCHFEIKNDTLNKFLGYKEAIQRRKNKIFVNLPKITKSQLSREGVLEPNIESSNQCTFCQKNKYFSYRRDKPNKVQAMLAYIAMS